MLPIVEADLEVIAKASPPRRTPVTRPQRKFLAATSETSDFEAPPTFDLKSGFQVSSLPSSSDEDSGLPKTADLSSEGSP